jgi:membrane protein
MVGFAASFAVISLLFAMMFKWLPDTKVEWRDVWLGGILTAALFEVGKFLIGLYIGK